MRAKPSPDPGVQLRDAYRQKLAQRAQRWATLYAGLGDYYCARNIAAIDNGETVIAVPAWELVRLGVELPKDRIYQWDILPDNTITPSVIDRISA